MTSLETAFYRVAPHVRFSLASILLFVAAMNSMAMAAQGRAIQESASNYLLDDGTGTLLGSVIYKSSSLILPTSVYAYRLTVSEGRSIFVQACVTTVEKDGSYNCHEVPVGQYVLLAVPSSRPFRTNQPSDVSSTSIAAYYLAFQPFSKSNLVTVGANQHVTVDFHITPRATYGFRGRLQNVDVTSDITLFLVSDSGYTLRLPNQSLVGNGGTFGFDALPAGHYLVRGQRFIKGRKQVAAEDVKLPQPTNIATDFHYPELHDVTIQIEGLQNDEGVPKFSLIEINSRERYAFTEPGITKTAHFADIPSGKYRVELEDNKSRCIELEGATDQIVDLPDGNSDIPLRGLYRENCVTMKGRLRDGKPGDVIVADGSYHYIARLRTDANGAFAFTGLLPGDYTLFGWRSSKAVPFNDPLYLAGLCGGVCRITLSSDDSDTDSVQVDVQPAVAP